MRHTRSLTVRLLEHDPYQEQRHHHSCQGGEEQLPSAKSLNTKYPNTTGKQVQGIYTYTLV